MNAGIYLRLSVMMFLQFFVWGVWWVALGPYMATDRIGMGALIFLAYLSQPIAAMISPFFLGLIADRYFPSQLVLGALHLTGAIMLACVPFFSEAAEGVAEFGFITFIILHMLCYMPTIGLTNAVAFNTMTDPEKQFPVVRVFGTIGWIVSNLVVGVLLAYILTQAPEHTAWPFYLGAGAAFVMAIYSLTLPHTPPPMKGQQANLSQILGLDAVRQLSSRSFWVFIIASLLICIPLAAYYSYAAAYADHAGMAREIGGFTFSVTAWMSTGQMTEVLFMLLMPLAFARLGVKWMLVVGMAAWGLRYALFAMGAPDQVFWMIWVGILLHGVCYDFFFVTGMVYVEKKASPAIRAQAQGFLVQMTLGVGMFIGTLAAGWWHALMNIDELGGQERMAAYQSFWWGPAILAAIVLVFFALTFKDQAAEPPEEAVPEEPATMP